VASKGACGHDVRGRESIENRRLCEKGMTRHFWKIFSFLYYKNFIY